MVASCLGQGPNFRKYRISSRSGSLAITSERIVRPSCEHQGRLIISGSAFFATIEEPMIFAHTWTITEGQRERRRAEDISTNRYEFQGRMV
jgi:hypothetical protein